MAGDLGNPEEDEPLTWRVHPNDDRNRPGARRVMKVANDERLPWALCTGATGDSLFLTDAEVATWPYTTYLMAKVAERNRALDYLRGRRAAAEEERGDMGVEAFMGEGEVE